MRARALRTLARGAQALGLGAVFVLAVSGGAMLHANSDVTRRLARSITNDALGKLFLGKLVVGEVQELRLGPWGRVHVTEVEIFDPEGNRVVYAKGVTGRIDLAKLITSLVKSGTPEVSLAEARIDDAEVLVDVDAKGDLGISRAFFPRPSAKPTKPSAKPAAGEAVRLAIPDAKVRHAWVHGNVVPPKLDADADDVHARVFISENRLKRSAMQVEIEHIRGSKRRRGKGADK